MASSLEKVAEPKDDRIADWHIKQSIQLDVMTRKTEKGDMVILTKLVVVASMYSSITDLIFKILLVQCPINSAIVF